MKEDPKKARGHWKLLWFGGGATAILGWVFVRFVVECYGICTSGGVLGISCVCCLNRHIFCDRRL